MYAVEAKATPANSVAVSRRAARDSVAAVVTVVSTEGVSLAGCGSAGRFATLIPRANTLGRMRSLEIG